RQVRHDPLDQLDDALILRRVVDADRLVVFGEQIAQQAADDALLAIEHRRRARRLVALPHLGPDAVKQLEIADDVLLRPPGGGGADDHAAGEAVRVAELADDAAQAAALLARLDLARYADVIDGRHEHQETPRHGDVRGEPRAFGAERLLHHLDDDLLPLAQQRFDLRLRPLTPRLALLPAAALLVVVAGQLVELVDRVDDVGDVEKPVALQADVDEGGLHAGKDFRDPALVDVADRTAVPLALDEDLGDEIVLENRHHRLVTVRRDDHFFGHHEPQLVVSRQSEVVSLAG